MLDDAFGIGRQGNGGLHHGHALARLGKHQIVRHVIGVLEREFDLLPRLGGEAGFIELQSGHRAQRELQRRGGE